MQKHICTKCGAKKDESEFYHYEYRGRDRICKECRRSYSREYQHSHPEQCKNFLAKHPGYTKKIYKKHRQKIREKQIAKYCVNLEKYRLKNKINYAIRKANGKIAHPKKHTPWNHAWGVVRNAKRYNHLIPSPCMFIDEKGLECRKLPTVAHHPDYSKPLEIIWFCKDHHALTWRKY